MLNDNYTVTTVDLLRHGQCEGGEIFRGSTDVVLTKTGWQQMHNAIGNEHFWDKVISSSLLRCQLFSNELTKQYIIPLSVYSQFREIHFGDWEGVDISLVQQQQPDLLRGFWADPLNNTPPNAESIVDFNHRVQACFTSVVENHPGQHLLFVVHGAVIRVLMCELLNMPLTSISNIAVPYACFTRFKFFSSEGKKPWVQLCFHRGH